MSIDFVEFCKNCEEIEKQTSALPGSEWILSTHTYEDQNEVYLCHKQIYKSDSSFLTCEYHAIYSDSYENPILYFNIWRPNGKLLSLEEIWQTVFNKNKDQLGSDPLYMITQQEHPTFHRPWYIVHPCKTHEFMSKLEKNNKLKNYVLSWLSCVSTLIGLDLPLCLGSP